LNGGGSGDTGLGSLPGEDTSLLLVDGGDTDGPCVNGLFEEKDNLGKDDIVILRTDFLIRIL
jgi:hypothetical protein